MRLVLVTLPLSFALAGCAGNHEPSSDERAAYAKNDMTQTVLCGKEHVREVDDRISDAQTVALALSYRCDSEYKKGIDSYFLYRINDSSDADALRNSANETYLSKQMRINTFLPQVMSSRAVKN